MKTDSATGWASVQCYLWSADADHAGVVPAGGVAEDGDEHEHPGDDLEAAGDLEQAQGGGHADAEPGQQREHRGEDRQAWEHGGRPPGGGQDRGEGGERASTRVNTVPAAEIISVMTSDIQYITCQSTSATTQSYPDPLTGECRQSIDPGDFLVT